MKRISCNEGVRQRESRARDYAATHFGPPAAPIVPALAEDHFDSSAELELLGTDHNKNSCKELVLYCEGELSLHDSVVSVSCEPPLDLRFATAPSFVRYPC